MLVMAPKVKQQMRCSAILLLFITLAPLLHVQSQDIPIGTWRTHFNYSQAKKLLKHRNKIFVASRFGLFYFDTEDNSLNKLTKNDGLTDVGITAMAETPDGKVLVIGYESGQIDLLEDNRLTGISTIKHAAIASNKSINHIFFHNDFAYLCTGFGLVALDYLKKEIKESYSKIGTNGSVLPVLSGTVYNDSIFLATQEGPIASSTAPTNNLMDFNNWRRFSPKGSTGPAKLATTFSENLYVSIEDQGLFQYNGYEWTEVSLPSHNIRNLYPSSSYLYILSQEKILQLNSSLEITSIENAAIRSPSDMLVDQEGRIFIADLQQGLVIINYNGSFEHFHPNGPLLDRIDRLYYFDNKIVAWTKGYNDQMQPVDMPAAFSVFNMGRWENFPEDNTASLVGITDIAGMAYSSARDVLYLGTFGGEVMEWHSNGEVTFLNVNLPFADEKITAMATDLDGKVLFNTYNAYNQLYAFDEAKSEWAFRPLGGGSAMTEIMTSDFQRLWLRSPDHILVADRFTNDTQILNYNNNNLIGGKIADLARDKNEMIWYGTSNGIAFIPNPWEALEGNARSIVPIYQNQALFRDEKIDVLKVDGANRKWIGTKDGLWVFGEDGDVLLAHFTESNSPLLSNIILDIEINPINGEVFIATAKGLVSFRSRTSEGSSSHQNVKIFPNPVRPGYNGQIGISGLVENATVKITDATGNLIREIRSLGGTATWDGNTLSGKRASTGVYLVFSASQDGTENFVGKLAIIQ